MATRIVTAAAVALAVVCPAHADAHLELHGSGRIAELPPASSIRIGTPTRDVVIASVRLVIEPFTNASRARMTLVLETPTFATLHSETSLAIPHGARVTGLALTLGNGPRTISAAVPADSAVGTYERLVRGNRDPALLTLEGGSERHDRLALRVFPLTKAAPATVELDLELPPAPSLTVESTQRIDALTVEVAGSSRGTSRFDEAREIALPPPRREMALAAHAVDGRTSLFVDEPPSGPGHRARHTVVVISCGIGHVQHSVSLDKREIRTEVRRHREQLGYCYTRQAQRHPELEGDVALHFRIGPDGRTTDITVDGSLDSDTAKQCMSEQVAQWRFHEHDGVVQVNYPIALSMLR
jgi:hypothetical protein